jgi:predicted ATPase
MGHPRPGCVEGPPVQPLGDKRILKRFILTGAPGSGKTVILRQLEVDGYSVVEEAATDVIALWQARGMAEPWTQPEFIDVIVELQTMRQVGAPCNEKMVQFHDRSPVCTAALATYLGFPFSKALSSELERISTEAIFQRKVFFVRNLGFISPSDARRISFEEALRFERIHEDTYRRFGFDLIYIEPGTPSERATAIAKIVSRSLSAQGNPG